MLVIGLALCLFTISRKRYHNEMSSTLHEWYVGHFCSSAHWEDQKQVLTSLKTIPHWRIKNPFRWQGSYCWHLTRALDSHGFSWEMLNSCVKPGWEEDWTPPERECPRAWERNDMIGAATCARRKVILPRLTQTLRPSQRQPAHH